MGASLALVALGACGLMLAWIGFLHPVAWIGSGVLVLCGLVALGLDRRAARIGPARLLQVATAVRLVAPATLALIVLTDPGEERILARGRAVAAAVEAFESERGRLPTTLAEVEVANPLTRYGRWRYHTDDDAGFSLVFGDYARDGFEIWYDGAGRDFHVDR